MLYDGWEPVIGLEIHAQLQTSSKMFSSDSTEFGARDNECVSPVSLGLPGALPVVNREAIALSMKTGLALNCRIRDISVFSRKNYFYPDLPKGYQISQFDKPLCEKGFVDYFLGGRKKRVRVTRAHVEEDAGKSIHQGEHTLINLNRAGVPLLEIVSEPDMRTSEEAAEYARAVRRILRYLEVCDGNLEEGSMRCDCNVSVRKRSEKGFRTRTELKNINSFRFIEKAINYEIQRQIDCYESGGEVVQETRLYDSTKNKTFSMRKKEEAYDYRYFPEPDLLPLVVDESWVSEIRKTLPELPLVRAVRFQKEYNLPEYDALILTQEREYADYYEVVAKLSGNPKASSNWIMSELMRELNESKKDISESPVSSDHLAELIRFVGDKTISGKMAKAVFAEMWSTGRRAGSIIEEKGLVQITDESEIEKIVNEIITRHPDQVEQYVGGKEKLFGFFVGQVMKVTKGQANPELVNKLLKQKL